MISKFTRSWQLLVLGFLMLFLLSLSFFSPSIPGTQKGKLLVPNAVPISNEGSTTAQTQNNPALINRPSSLDLSPDLPDPSAPLLSFGKLLLVHGDYVNESNQEAFEVWVTFFQHLGFNSTPIHINMLPTSIDYDLMVVLPSVGTRDPTFGVSKSTAEIIANTSNPILLIGYAHEILDLLGGFNPLNDLIPTVERYVWESSSNLQIFTLPHLIPINNNRYDIYSNHIYYDAYRIASLPYKVSLLGLNYDGASAQILWFRAAPSNQYIYYWGLDQVNNLNLNGYHFCENLIHWILRSDYSQRLQSTIANLQLSSSTQNDYWAIQGLGGFGYPLEPSIANTFYVADVVQSNNLAIDITAFKLWLLNCYNPMQGFFADLSSLQLADRCITTSMSVLAANGLGILDQFDSNQISDYLVRCQDPITGGFLKESDSSQTSLKATRFAIEALALLGMLSKINVTAVISFISSCQEADPYSSEFGGFYSSPNTSLVASLVTSVDALVSLNVLNALNSINQTALLDFLFACEDQVGSSIFDTQITMDSNEWTLGTSCAIQLLATLNSMDSCNITNSRAFLLASQYPNGGWGRGDSLHDFHNSPDETWLAVQGLLLTGGLGSSQEALEQYLAYCCTGWGGATEPTLFGDFLTSTHLVSALYEVEALDALNLTAFLIYLENCWSILLTSYRSHALAPGVATDTDIPTPDRLAMESGTFGPLYHYAYGRLLQHLNLTNSYWAFRNEQIRHEIEACQTFSSGYDGMFGLHHLYIGHESDFTFRFDSTCWSLIAHQKLGGTPFQLINLSAALAYLSRCLHENQTYQFFADYDHLNPLPAPWRFAGGNLADTWLGLQAWAYLDPSLTGLNGTLLANYAHAFLSNNPTLVTAFYATEILYFLKETNLYTNALSFLDQNELSSLLLNAFTVEGLVEESALPTGKWTPYLLDLALQLINRLDLLPRLDVSPILTLSQIITPTGILETGTSVFFSAIVNETRWGLIPNDIRVFMDIFNTKYSNSCSSLLPGYWQLTPTIPITSYALGPQNLTLITFAPGAIPCYIQMEHICEVWGTISLHATYMPGLEIPRSIPLNISIQLTLDGDTGPVTYLANGNVTIALQASSAVYILQNLGSGFYETTIPTSDLSPEKHNLRLNATHPYCPPLTITELLSIIVFDTFLTVEQIHPLIPLLFEPVSIQVAALTESGTPLLGYELKFNITRPDEPTHYFEFSANTNDGGIATCSWIPDLIGQWQITYAFTAQGMYSESANFTTVNISRRPLFCSIQLLSSSTLFIGNRSTIHVIATDSLNGSTISNLTVKLYENNLALATTYTNETGQAACEWTVSAPVGYRSLRIEIAETSTHQQWISPDLNYLVKDTTALTITTSIPTLYGGEIISLEVNVVAAESPPPNGIASLYWDGQWYTNFPIQQGLGSTNLLIPFSAIPGEHQISILFGHLDVPDSYQDSSSEARVIILSTITPSLSLSVYPIEINDYYLTPTITVEVWLTYFNGAQFLGLQTNLTLQLITQNASLLFEIMIPTNEIGFFNISLSTPPPGIYTLIIIFEGQRGFLPCTQNTPLLVHYPFNLQAYLVSPLVISSIMILVIGVITGIFGFIRQQRQVNRFSKIIQPAPNNPPNSSSNQAYLRNAITKKTITHINKSNFRRSTKNQ